jgi:hypothetical protein
MQPEYQQRIMPPHLNYYQEPFNPPVKVEIQNPGGNSNVTVNLNINQSSAPLYIPYFKPEIIKKIFIGPTNNKINLFRILKGENNLDDEVMKLTTLMIRNIPVKTLQSDLLAFIDENFYGKYDYFYLPIDLKTH